jgi:hypothetical protein
MIEAVIQKFVDGIAVKDTGVYAREASSYGKGGVRRLEVYIADDSSKEPLLHIAVFPGRSSHLRPWFELFCIKDCISPERTLLRLLQYYDFTVEEALLSMLS